MFKNRIHAGKLLSEAVLSLKNKLKDPLVLGIPRGGVPIGYIISEALNCTLDAIILRKLPVPSDPETGFGAVTVKKTAVFNEELLNVMKLSKNSIDAIVDSVYKEVIRRNSFYRKDKAFPELKGRSVILTDDGLATGYTMLAAVRYIKAESPYEVIAAAPVAHLSAYDLVSKEADKIISLHISRRPSFAVAAFYDEFHEMNDSEVMYYLKKAERAEKTRAMYSKI